MTPRHSKVHRAPWKAPRPTRWAAIAALATLFLAPGRTGGLAAAQTPAELDTANAGTSHILVPADRQVLPAVEQPFRRGEYLRFTVQYGFIHAGSAYLEVTDRETVDGHPSLVLQARAESNAFFSHVYKVRNKIQSFWDEQGRFSRRYVENRHEGGYKKSSDVVFDYDRLEARYKDGQTYPIPPHVQDALSAFYYARTQSLPLGGSIVFDYHASRKSQPLEVKVLGREKIETPAGTFQCVAIEPLLKAGGIFKNSGRLVIWITDDDRRMPVLMKSKVSVGSISVVLQEYRPGA